MHPCRSGFVEEQTPRRRAGDGAKRHLQEFDGNDDDAEEPNAAADLLRANRSSRRPSRETRSRQKQNTASEFPMELKWAT